MGADTSSSGGELDFSQKMAAALDAAGVPVDEDQPAAPKVVLKKPGMWVLCFLACLRVWVGVYVFVISCLGACIGVNLKAQHSALLLKCDVCSRQREGAV